MIRSADVAFYSLIKAIGRTIRFEVEGQHHFDSIIAAGKLPIYAFWHDRIFASTYYFRGRDIVVITSQSRDGEYIARFIQRLGYGSIRGSSTRGGVGALVEMIRAMRSGYAAAFTVDGPKGPRYVAKPGPVMLAKKTGNPILPFLVECRNYRTVNSWDRMQIPSPFTAARLIYAEPIWIKPDADETALAQGLKVLQSSLDQLIRRGKQYKKGFLRERFNTGETP